MNKGLIQKLLPHLIAVVVFVRAAAVFVLVDVPFCHQPGAAAFGPFEAAAAVRPEVAFAQFAAAAHFEAGAFVYRAIAAGAAKPRGSAVIARPPGWIV